MAADKCTLIPEQLFDSQDAFISHVKHFALENGFNVRLDDVERDKGGSIRKRDIVCSSEGAPRGKESSSKREDSVCRSDIEDSEPMTPTKTSGLAHSGAHRRKSMKTGCRWLARASRQSSGMWKMIMLRLEHNHPLTARYELFQPSSHVIRTGDDSSIGNATVAARAAMMNGTYRGPSLEFKDLFLQMSAACADLCWSAARHPETVAEVLSEIRRLNQHLDKHAEHDDYEMHGSRSPHTRSVLLPPVSENGEDTNGESMDVNDKLANSGDSSLVMMGHNINDMINHRISAAQPQPSHFLNVPPHSASQHMEMAMSDSPAQILARSQNRHIVEAQSPELNSTSNISIAVHNGSAPDGALSPTTPSTALPATGPVKRPRGRPRKNPITGDSKSTKSKAQQKRDQLQRDQQQVQQQVPQVPPPTQPTPTPADLASLTHQIINQNAASSPANVQRSIGTSLALPSQSMQMHSHHGSRTSIIGAGGNVPPILDTRSHANPVQRQQQGPVPQPQQSPTFFLGAAEGIGYPERSAAAAAANLGSSSSNSIRSSLCTFRFKRLTRRRLIITSNSRNSSTNNNSNPTISDPATNAAAPVDAPAIEIEQRGLDGDASGYWAPPSGRSRTAATGSVGERDGSRLAKARLATKAMAVDPSATSSDSPHLSTVNSIAPTFPSYQSYQQQQSYYNYQQQRMEQQQYHAEQPPEAAGAGSPPVSAISQLVISSNSAVPGATGYSQPALVGAASAANSKNGNQRTTANHPYHQYQQSHQHLLHQQQHQSQTQQLLQLGSSNMHAAASQMSRDPATSATQLNSYWLMSRAQQQKQQQQPHADHLASISAHHHQQSPATALSSLPPMTHNGDVLPGAGRRLDELQLNQYQGMNNWQM
ncbi:hypothetical protein GGH94_002218 [Coemansia aciculifera]|uniref:FAR1 domain-containing protein n=1 Tax=Coemansia aciculifera TaxID=417176 RepID=A0A9W8M490_9FUNG|nr:hypothetical protein GGH94_002218 [Coemansia aciculifera]